MSKGSEPWVAIQRTPDALRLAAFDQNKAYTLYSRELGHLNRKACLVVPLSLMMVINHATESQSRKPEGRQFQVAHIIKDVSALSLKTVFSLCLQLSITF